MNTLQKWDQIYMQKEDKPEAAWVLKSNQHLLPAKGIALDLACGLGGNALLLAEKGLQVWAWDHSAVAIEKLNQRASQKKLDIEAQVRDVIQHPPEPDSVDVLIVSFFLHRALCPQLVRAVKKGGVLFYQTYCQQKVKPVGPANPDYLLADNELLQLFSTLKLRVYREEALLGNHRQGIRNQALLVAEK